MSLLKTLLGWLITPILHFIYDKVQEHLNKKKEEAATDMAIEKKNQEVREATEKAETVEQRKEAAREVFKNFDKP